MDSIQGSKPLPKVQLLQLRKEQFPRMECILSLRERIGTMIQIVTLDFYHFFQCRLAFLCLERKSRRRVWS